MFDNVFTVYSKTIGGKLKYKSGSSKFKYYLTHNIYIYRYKEKEWSMYTLLFSFRREIGRYCLVILYYELDPYWSSSWRLHFFLGLPYTYSLYVMFWIKEIVVQITIYKSESVSEPIKNLEFLGFSPNFFTYFVSGSCGTSFFIDMSMWQWLLKCVIFLMSWGES